MIYYVDSQSGAYNEYKINDIYGNFEVQEEGTDFFAESRNNIKRMIHPEDRDRLEEIMEKEYLIQILQGRRQYSIDYRLLIGEKEKYTRLTATWAADRIHFIIGVQNVDEEICRERERQVALNSANEMARRDGLTGVKNKYAYHEMEQSIQCDLENGRGYFSFAIVVCDINDLKVINDTKGHSVGDIYIQDACKMICDVFSHSPVYRVGGDEFAVILTGNDHLYRYELCDKFKAEVLKNEKKEGTPIVAIGMAEYDDAVDRTVSDVFKRADDRMYRNKEDLKKLVRKEGI
jgi:diguanylate cyclase (GGDEF)-like protein